jgi:single-strand DNA-binding protein
VEVVADEVAPSLRWATAQVQKIDRRDGAPAGGSSGGGGRPVANEPTNYDGEEPF